MPLPAEGLFCCVHYSRPNAPTLLSEQACVERQYRARKTAGGRYTFAVFDYCAAGCAQGKEIAQRRHDLVAGRERPKPRPLRLPAEVICIARTPSPPSSCDQDHGGSALDYAAERFAEQDAARSAELWSLIRNHPRCEICGRKLHEGNSVRVCSLKACKVEYRKRRRERVLKQAERAPAPPPGAAPAPPSPPVVRKPPPGPSGVPLVGPAPAAPARARRFAAPPGDPLAALLADRRAYSYEERIEGDERLAALLAWKRPTAHQIQAHSDRALCFALGVPFRGREACADPVTAPATALERGRGQGPPVRHASQHLLGCAP